MSRSAAFVVLLLGGCTGDRARSTDVEILRVAPTQMLGDSLEVTPALDTTQDAPDRADVALSIEVRIRNASASTKPVPRIAFRAVAESARDTTARWRYEITRRSVDSLRGGESANFGVSTSPRLVAAGDAVDGLYRVEAMFGDSIGRRVLPVGRIRLRSDSVAARRP